MKKRLSQAIALATLAGAAFTAQAVVQVNHEGLGGALLYPVYTVNSENSTLVSVVNTTNQYKAVKVRFLEGKNSAEVLDFHLYLSPYDTWSGAIVATANGAKVTSSDTSCVPGFNSGFPADGIPFRNFEILSDSMATNGETPTGADVSEARVRVGHFEVIEMGVVDPGFILQGTGPTAVTAEGAIKHVNGVPGNCAAVTAAWSPNGVWEGTTPGDRAGDKITKIAGMSAPTGGLYGTGVVINVPSGWTASYDAVALGDTDKDTNLTLTANDAATVNTVTDVQLAAANGTSTDAEWRAPQAGGGLWSIAQHPRPGSVYPNLDTIDLNNRGLSGEVGSEVVPGAYAAQGFAVRRVSNALNVSSVYNDYYVSRNVGAETDMVISFPTKRFHVNIKPDNGVVAAPVRQRTSPFTNGWNLAENKSCETIAVTYYNKEEGVGTVEIGMVSPRPTEPTFSLCYETNILSVRDSDVLGGGDLRQQFDLDFNAGWFSVALTGANDNTEPDTAGTVILGNTAGTGVGLPLIGFSTILTKNGNVGGKGVLANFAQTFKNKTVTGVAR